MSDGPAEDEILLRPQSGEEAAKPQFDVFLCYDRESDEDRHNVKKIGNQLKAKEIVPWFDEWEVRPGTSWQRAVGQQIEEIKAAAVFVGQRGVDSWLKLLIEALLDEFVEQNCPVIPVLLPNAPHGKPKLPPLLKIMDPVDFRILKQNPNPAPDEDPLNRLIFGITGRPVWDEQAASIRLRKHTPTSEVETKLSSYVLIASLGPSPVAISAMYDLLTKSEGLTIDSVVVLRSESEDAALAYELVRETLADRCKLHGEVLPLEDTNSWTNACLFLKKLYTLLNTCQTRGDSVYLSLTGASESTAALMASTAPTFSCVKHLYHAIDPDEEHFLSVDELELDMAPLQRRLAMYPDLEQFALVDIPFELRQQINQQIISRLLATTEDELTRMEYDQEIAVLPRFSLKPAYALEELPLNSVLVVPLAKTLMVATQLYTLLQHQENRNIHQVVLVYPAQATEIAREADLIRRALREEANIRCTYVSVPGLTEIDSPGACRRYQAALESVIDRARRVYPDCRIDLAFSQVQKSVVAATIFAAQKKQLSYVYHTLITDKQLGEAIDQQTTIEVLDNLSRERRNDRLFLRAYEDEGVYTKFVLFKIPVFFP